VAGKCGSKVQLQGLPTLQTELLSELKLTML